MSLTVVEQLGRHSFKLLLAAIPKERKGMVGATGIEPMTSTVSR